MRISDWSSDVCSSDLLLMDVAPEHGLGLCPIGRLPAETLGGSLDLGADREVIYGFVGGLPDPSSEDLSAPARDVVAELADWARARLPDYLVPSSDGRRVGTECVSTCSFRGAPC